MTDEENVQLQQSGARARAAGRAQFDNPFYKSANCPAATGDTVDQWQAKLDAWNLGWLIEDAMR